MKIRNNARSVRELMIPDESFESPALAGPSRYARKVRIEPGQSVDVDDTYLTTRGAQILLESGDLEIIEEAA